MSVPKTKPTEVSAKSYIAAIANEEQRNDAERLVVLMRKATKQEPRMWGPGIVGFGSYHYRYASGHEGVSALAGFAARGRELVVYIAAEFEGRDAPRSGLRARVVTLESDDGNVLTFNCGSVDGDDDVEVA